MEAYGNAQKEWEANAKKTLENNQMEIEKYKEIIENKKLNIDQMSAAITIATAPFQNKLMFDYGQEKNINGVLNLYDKMTAIQERLKSSTETLLGFNENDLTSIKSSIDQYNAHPEQLSGLTNEQFQKLRILGEQHGWTLNNPAAGISPTSGYCWRCRGVKSRGGHLTTLKKRLRVSKVVISRQQQLVCMAITS